jgi:putative flippase GtrA
VRLVRFLPERWQKLAHELVKFCLVGGANTIIDFIVWNLLLPVGSLKAKVASTIVATTSSYFMNRHWTFRHRDRSSLRREYVLFFGLNLVGLGIQLAVLAAASYGLGYHHADPDSRLPLNIANAVGIGVAMVFRFWAYRTFVFTANTPESVAVAAAEAVADAVPVAPAQRVDEFDELTVPLEVELADAEAELAGLEAERGAATRSR